MLTDEIRARLEQLNRERLPPVAPERKRSTREPSPTLCSLDDLLDSQVTVSEAGSHYRLRKPLAHFWPHLPDRLDPTGGCEVRKMDSHPELVGFEQAFPDRAMFLDLETCGFAGSPIFLIGLVYSDGGRLVVDQLLARDYTEERAILDTLWRIAAGHDVLVTFNGKSFDWPMVRDRTFFHRLNDGGSEPAVHFDLLHHARRKWKRVLPNCRLQTLERYVCGRLRRGDIPGSQIPAAYHQYVRSGDARQMVSVLHHNALDLVTLAQLAVRITAGFERAVA